MACRLPRASREDSTSHGIRRISGPDRGQRNSSADVNAAADEGLEQRRGLLSERPLAGGPSRSHEGPSEEDPGAAHAVSGADDEALFRRDGLIRDVRSGSNSAEVRGGIVEKRPDVNRVVGLVAVAKRVRVRVDELAESGKVLVSRWPHVDLRALREAIAQPGIVESAGRIVA